MTSSALLFSVPACIALVALWYHRPKRSSPYPPGPTPNVFLGNLLDFPRYEQWQTFTRWKNEYGDLVFLRILGRNYLILNSMKACNDLFGRRGANYADRPRAVMLGELSRFERSVFFMNYENPHFKINQRLIQSVLNPTAVRHYLRLQQASSAHMLTEILDDPDNHIEYLERSSAKTGIKIMYGLEMSEDDLRCRQEAVQRVTGNVSPVEFIVDIFPILKYFPSWAPWHKRSKVLAKQMEHVMGAAFERAEKEIANGTARESFVGRILQDPEYAEKGPEFREILKWCAGTMSVAGETSSVVVTVFLWAMCINPEAQIKAQKEIDEVIGANRLPTVEDRENLPYLMALIQEVLRWYLITPLGAPHATARDDTYEGYFIPKGTIVIGNSYGIAQSESGLNPEDFRPERYFTGECKIDPRDYVFGYGRRRCPGRAMAEDTLFLNVSAILSCFNVAPKDKDIKPPSRARGVILCKPGTCPCTITPRSEEHRSLIISTALTLSAEE